MNLWYVKWDTNTLLRWFSYGKQRVWLPAAWVILSATASSNAAAKDSNNEVKATTSCNVTMSVCVCVCSWLVAMPPTHESGRICRQTAVYTPETCPHLRLSFSWHSFASTFSDRLAVYGTFPQQCCVIFPRILGGCLSNFKWVIVQNIFTHFRLLQKNTESIKLGLFGRC